MKIGSKNNRNARSGSKSKKDRTGPPPSNNPYLVLNTDDRESKPNFSLWSELRRLFGGFRSPFTLLFLIIPLLLGLAGGFDILSDKLYETAKRGQPDPRERIVLVQCWRLGKPTTQNPPDTTQELEQVAEKCRGVSSPLGLGGERKYQLWPFESENVIGNDDTVIKKQVPQEIVLGLLLLAFTAYLAIGNPRMQTVLPLLGQAFGWKDRKGSRAARQTDFNRSWALDLVENEDRLKTVKLEVVKSEDLPVPFIALSPSVGQADNIYNRRLTKIERHNIRTAENQAAAEELLRNCLVLGGYRQRHWSNDPGYFYFDREAKPVPYWLSTSMLKTNLLIVAPPGSGKTLSVFQPLVGFVRRAEAAGFFFDAKGDDFDPTLFDYNFSLNDPNHSIKINLYSGTTPEQAGERLAEALIPVALGEGAQEYFANNAKDALSLLVAAHVALFAEYPTPSQLVEYLTSSSNLNFLQSRIEAQLTDDYGRRLSAILRRIISLSSATKNDILGMLATALIPLTNAPADKLLVANPTSNPDEEDNGRVFTVEELLKQPGLTRIALPVADYPRLAGIIGRLLLAQFSYAVLSPKCNRQLFKLAAVDEARYFITQTFANGMAQARSNNAGYALSFQTLAQIREEELRDTIFAASGTKLVMAGVGDKDAERFSKTFGGLELQYANRVRSAGTTQNKNRSASTSRGQETEGFGLVGGVFEGSRPGRESKRTITKSQGSSTGENQSWSTSFPQRLRPRFLPSEVRELPKYHAIIESSDDTGQRWFAGVIDMSQSVVAELESGIYHALIGELENLPRQKSKSRR